MLGGVLAMGIVLAVVLGGNRSHSDAAARPTTATTRATPVHSSFGMTTVAVADSRAGCPRRSLPRPSALPADLPLPRGTLFTEVRRRDLGPGSPPYAYVFGLVPLALQPAVRFFVKEFPRAGYHLSGGDAEPWEAESRFGGKGRNGAFVLNIRSRCRGHILLLVIVSQPAAVSG